MVVTADSDPNILKIKNDGVETGIYNISIVAICTILSMPRNIFKGEVQYFFCLCFNLSASKFQACVGVLNEEKQPHEEPYKQFWLTKLYALYQAHAQAFLMRDC